jgi:hypothetical protein
VRKSKLKMTSQFHTKTLKYTIKQQERKNNVVWFLNQQCVRVWNSQGFTHSPEFIKFAFQYVGFTWIKKKKNLIDGPLRSRSTKVLAWEKKMKSYTWAPCQNFGFKDQDDRLIKAIIWSSPPLFFFNIVISEDFHGNH